MARDIDGKAREDVAQIDRAVSVARQPFAHAGLQKLAQAVQLPVRTGLDEVPPCRLQFFIYRNKKLEDRERLQRTIFNKAKKPFGAYLFEACMQS